MGILGLAVLALSLITASAASAASYPTVATDKVTVGAQGPLSSVAIANSGTGVSVRATITDIAYTVVQDGFGCTYSGTGAKTGATYTHLSAVKFASTNGATLYIE